MTNYGDDISHSAHRLSVKRWIENWQAHECECDGKVVIVDLFVDGGLQDETPESLIGKTVEVEYTHGFLWIAQGPRIVDPEPSDEHPLSPAVEGV